MSKLLISISFLVHFSLGYEIQRIPLPPMKFPDGLHWDASSQNLYFCDLYSENATICRYSYDIGAVFCTTVEGESYPSFIIPVKGCKNQFAIGFGRCLKIVYWSGVTEIAKVVRTVFSLKAKSNVRLNKAIADPKGRYYGGTDDATLCGGSANQSFYRYSYKRKCPKKLYSKTTSTTGVAIDKHSKTLYHLDGCHGIMGFDWKSKTGQICNGRCVFNFNPSNSIPSYDLIGLNVDCRGLLYTGTFYGSKVWVIDPKTSTVVDQIQLPTELILTPTFGGPNLDEIFVSSGTQTLDLATGQSTKQKLTPEAGTLFRIIGYGSKGYPGNSIRV